MARVAALDGSATSWSAGTPASPIRPSRGFLPMSATGSRSSRRDEDGGMMLCHAEIRLRSAERKVSRPVHREDYDALAGDVLDQIYAI
jgi:hypothetical protein